MVDTFFSLFLLQLTYFMPNWLLLPYLALSRTYTLYTNYGAPAHTHSEVLA